MTFTPGNIYEKTLVVAMDYDYQPYSFFDGNGKPAGFDVELIYALADKMGVNADVRLMPWNDARNSVLSGRADLLTGLELCRKTCRPLSCPFPCTTIPSSPSAQRRWTA